jgi:hypothetical protein
VSWPAEHDDQFGAVARRLRATGLVHWLDAGSLLGVIREGALLPWDNDIDIGCWASDRQVVQSAIAMFRRNGYRVAPRTYHRSVYQVKLRPPAGSQLKTVDIALYSRCRDVAWCPVNYVSPQPAPRGSARWLVEKPFREAVIRPWMRRSNRTSLQTRIPRLRLEVRTWVVPAHFFERQQEIDLGQFSVPVPEDYEGYLQLRYGNWRKPRREWDYGVDDGALAARPPEEVLASLRRLKNPTASDRPEVHDERDGHCQER